MKRSHRILFSLPLFLLLAACSEEPKPASQAKKEPEKPPEAVTAQYAFHQMFLSARGWAPDATPLRMGNLELKEVKSEGGKAGAWECTFVSERSRAQRRYTYSVIETANLRKGAFGGPQDGWTPGGQSKPFPIQAFKADAAAAYEVAAKKGADYAKKHPDMPVNFILEATKRFPNPAWRVIWGESVSRSSYSIFVDATTGEYLQTAR